MEIVFTATADADLEFWKKSGNISVLKKIRQLLESIIASPFTGVGKPEPLRYNLAGYWSRRIIVHSLRGHYD